MTIERTYNVPLRKEWLKAPMYRRSKKAVTALTEFAAKHMKTDIENVKIGKQVNLLIWKNGIKNPPHHVKVNMVKEDDGIVKVELFGVKYEQLKIIEKQEKTKKDELMDKLGVKKAPKKEEKPAEEKKEETLESATEEKPKKTRKTKTEATEEPEKQ
jgi:ribosomal protein L31E